MPRSDAEVQALVDEAPVYRPRSAGADTAGHGDGVSAEAGAMLADAAATTPVIREAVWLARPLLNQIRDFARQHSAAPDAVLHQAIARAAVQAPMSAGVVTMPGGDPSPLSLFVAIIGPSGAGKSSSTRLARRLVPGDDDVLMDVPIGSGEGVAEAYIGNSPSEDPKQAKRTQVRNRVHFHVDECEALTRLVKRDGATLGETLRRAFTGEALGQRNATAERTRVVRDYSLALTLNATPGAIVGLLQYAELGLPQRFLWASAIDPDAPRHPQCVRMPELPAIEPQPICCAAAIVDAIREARWLALRGEAQVDELDAHQTLIQARVAAVLTAWDGRTIIEREDWEIADRLTAASRAMRGWTIQRAEEQRSDAEAADAVRSGRRAQTVRAMVATADDAVQRVARRIAARVTRTGTATARDLNRCCTKARERHLFDAALDCAIANQWIAAAEDGSFKSAQGGHETFA